MYSCYCLVCALFYVNFFFVWGQEKVWHISDTKAVLSHLKVLTVNVAICITSWLKCLLFLFYFYEECKVYFLIDKRSSFQSCKSLSFYEVKLKQKEAVLSFVSVRDVVKN